MNLTLRPFYLLLTQTFFPAAHQVCHQIFFSTTYWQLMGALRLCSAQKKKETANKYQGNCKITSSGRKQNKNHSEILEVHADSISLSCMMCMFQVIFNPSSIHLLMSVQKKNNNKFMHTQQTHSHKLLLFTL